MPPLEQFDLLDYAVLCPFSGFDGYGMPTRDTPQEIMCRIERTKRQFIDPQGNTITTDAWMAVGLEVTVHSTVVLGRLSNWLGTGSAIDEEEEVYEVAALEIIPDVDNREIRYEIGLIRRGSTQSSVA